MEKTLTVCVAAYNIERYIDDLMESLIASRVMEDIEILLIDDGSSDNTFEKAADYQQRFPKTVRLISKQNGGHGSALNMGIREAAGKYFRTLDGDDWVDPINFAYLVRCIKHIDADAVLSDIYSCRPNGKIQKEYFPALEDDTLYTFDQLVSTVQWMSYHTIVFRTELLRSAGFSLDEHCYYVDTEYVLFPIPFVHTVYYCKPPVYCYRQGRAAQSVSAKNRQKNIGHSVTVTRSLIHYYKKNRQLFSPAQKAFYMHGVSIHCSWHVMSLLLCPASDRIKRRLISYESNVRKHWPECYDEMTRNNRHAPVIKALRKSGYALYRPVSLASRNLQYAFAK